MGVWKWGGGGGWWGYSMREYSGLNEIGRNVIIR